MCTYSNFVWLDTEIRVGTHQVDAQRQALTNFGRHQQTSGGDQLELRSRYRTCAQEAVQVVDGQWENLFFAFLLVTHLKHIIS